MRDDRARAVGVIRRLTLEEDLKENDVVTRVSEAAGITLAELLGGSRTQPLVTFRQGTYYLLRKNFGVTYETIGAIMGRRDHATIIHGVKNFKKLLATYQDGTVQQV